MIQGDLFSASPVAPPKISSQTPLVEGLPSIIDVIAQVSTRPRYAFMVLNLIARAAGQGGKAGPYVLRQGQAVRLRDWLCDSLAPMAARDHKRAALAEQVRVELAGQEQLPGDPDAASRLVDQVVLERVRRSGRCNVSRAVSELVRAGLVRRHYEGWRVDHHNRGARREAVYTLLPDTMRALGKA
ncbi:hypothetical protein [Sphingomonas aracearum]|uniref:Uncharacterized protein n=1 Tax=Sphingomonas aracearum TaxID=2283317 RepID=A0A369VSQ9_9SPHN|nr:hypothetical protein [Sphingomonas aracearum]RDE04210.1 hypothetical protein DVW87_17505 [Sphingomonas aracearum]